MSTLHRHLAASVVAIALVAAGCGDSDESADQPAPTPAPAGPSTATTPAPTPPSPTPAPTTKPPPPPPATPVPPPTAVPTTIAAAVTTAPPPTAAPTTTIEPGPLRITVDVYEGQVAGDTEVVIERGTEIEIVVTADVSDEVHVHGYDHKADVSPDSPAVITFVANLPGIYEVELEDSGQHIIELEVR